MKLKVLFMEEPVDFEKRCRLRILVGKTAAVLGLLSVAAAWFMEILGLWLETALSGNFIPGSGSALWPAGLHLSGRTGDI